MGKDFVVGDRVKVLEGTHKGEYGQVMDRHHGYIFLKLDKYPNGDQHALRSSQLLYIPPALIIPMPPPSPFVDFETVFAASILMQMRYHPLVINYIY